MDRDIEARLRGTTKHVLLLGPRQVGKSTLCRSLGPKYILNLADEGAFLSYSKDPGRLRRELAVLDGPSLVLIDEIQRVPPLLNMVQALLDEGCPHRFLLTGSSARKLKRGGANLLPGRILLEYMDPLSFWELGRSLDLDRALQLGTLPGIYLDSKEGADVLDGYAATYLREEIQAEALSRNLGAYARFLDVAAEASGRWINYSKVASDSELPKETVRRFYSILEDTLIAFRLPAYRPKRSHRRVSQRDRFLFFDTGVRNALLGLHRHPLSPSERGFLFEHWIILQCLTLIRSRHKPWKLSSYRTDAGAEVDLVIDQGKKLLAVECKSGSRVHETDLRGLRSFEEVADKPVEKRIVYRGSSRQKFSKGEVAVPYEDFLESLAREG